MLRPLVTTLLLASTAFAQTPSTADVLARWRAAAHAQGKPAQVALVQSTANEDGITGNIQEWVSRERDYRRDDNRSFDESSLVVTNSFGKLRDWNGFIRNLDGRQLQRAHNAAFERATLLFGPGENFEAAAVGESDDHKSITLKVTPPGGSEITWYIDPATSLPTKSVRPGDDTEITHTYSDWKSLGGTTTPQHIRVSETEKPDYDIQLVSVKFQNASASAFAPPQPGPSDATLDPHAAPIPFEMAQSHIVFKARVNGHQPIWFILDTGADQNVLNSKRMAAWNVKPYAGSNATGGGGTAEYDYVKDVTISGPGFSLNRQHDATIDASGLERALGMPFGGLLGYDFISRYTVEIDYARKLITLHDPAKWKYRSSGAIVPVVFDDGIPFTHATLSVAGHEIPGLFVIDFGAQETMTLTSPFIKANDLARLAQTNANVSHTSGLENQFFTQQNSRGRIDQLTVGDLKVSNIPINMSANTSGAYASANFAGTIGESIYQRYHVFLDYARNRVIFEPTPAANQPFPERQTYGLVVLASGPDLHTYTVTGVRAGSPAEAAGFKKGDVVSAVDGKPSSQFMLLDLRDWLLQDGKQMQFDITRGAEKLTIPVTVRLISLDRK